MKDKKGIASDFGDLIKALQCTILYKGIILCKRYGWVQNTFKSTKGFSITCSSYSSGVILGMLFAFAFDNKAIKEEENLKDYLQVLANEKLYIFWRWVL